MECSLSLLQKKQQAIDREDEEREQSSVELASRTCLLLMDGLLAGAKCGRLVLLTSVFGAGWGHAEERGGRGGGGPCGGGAFSKRVATGGWGVSFLVEGPRSSPFFSLSGCQRAAE